MLSWVEIKDLCSEFVQKKDWERLVRLLMVEFLRKEFFLMSKAQGRSGSASRGAEWLRRNWSVVTQARTRTSRVAEGMSRDDGDSNGLWEIRKMQSQAYLRKRKGLERGLDTRHINVGLSAISM
jgi:hypothetical protein